MHFTLSDILEFSILGFLVLIIVFFVSIYKSNKNRKNQLNRIEEKLNNIEMQTKNGNN